ncbi:MAG: hypothetical protein ACRDDY_03495 [Clostridium sp.]|uniref:hypothetical protein n=1 Tax=Clostridium sp. TaxID=1506 RepID=UPI003EE6949F
MEFNEFVNTYRDAIKEIAIKNELEMEYEISYGKDWKQSFLKRDMFEMEYNEKLRRLYEVKNEDLDISSEFIKKHNIEV